MNTLYTNGVIAVKEKSLLGEKLLRFAEMSAEEVFRALAESGFGSGAEDATDGESLCRAQSRALDEFIRESAPAKPMLEYLLLPRDYHNAKALVKAQKLGTGCENLLAPDGLYSAETLSSCIREGNFGELGALGETVKRACEEELSGAEIGFLFDDALYTRLRKSCRGTLGRLLAAKVDRQNILGVLRASEWDYAEKFLLSGGKLKLAELEKIFGGELPESGELKKFCLLARGAKEKGLPFTEAERALESFEAEYFAAHKYELEGKEPFLYYVFRCRAEIANVRILLVCLAAGFGEQEIKKRLRAI